MGSASETLIRVRWILANREAHLNNKTIFVTLLSLFHLFMSCLFLQDVCLQCPKHQASEKDPAIRRDQQVSSHTGLQMIKIIDYCQSNGR